MQQIGSLIAFIGLIVAGVVLIQEKDPGAPAPPPFSVVSVPFTELLSGDSAQVSRRVNYLITSDEGLKELWKLIGTKSTMPQVDFSTRAVVAVFVGEQTTGGYGIAISKIEDNASSRLVSVQLTSPGEGCVVTQAITSPYQIVTVPNSDLTFTHADTVVTTECK
jgi:hypothetical protein